MGRRAPDLLRGLRVERLDPKGSGRSARFDFLHSQFRQAVLLFKTDQRAPRISNGNALAATA